MTAEESAQPDKGVPCNSQLSTLDSDSVIDNLRTRHGVDEVYTWTGTILLAVNPYKAVPGLYGEAVMAETRGSKLLRAPHAYSVAERAYRQMARDGTNQSIVISGESGAGKTENCRIILQYLAARSRTEASLMEKRLLAANPILESFGCAKTLRNNNSSRFGKLVKTYFDDENRISASAITTYLLEKSRIVFHAEGERNYHIFYQLAAAAAAGHPLARELAPRAHIGCSYLARGGAPTIRGVDDLAEFDATIETLRLVGVGEPALEDVLRVLGGLLELGEIGFAENDQGQAEPNDSAALERTAAALGVEVGQLDRCLRTRTVVSGRGSSYTVHFSATQAATARDSLAKAVYERVFAWLVKAANASLRLGADGAGVGGAAAAELELELEPLDDDRFIATLDIFGFENFESNSFEQLLINYCNEKLQHQFLCHVVQQEQELYRHEMIAWRHLNYENNADAVALFEAYPTGLLWLMQEYARLPTRESAAEVEKKLTRRIHASHGGSLHLSVPRTRRGHALNSDDGFIVKHFAGDVCYSTEGFLEKNAENLHAELEMLVGTSARQCVALAGALAGGAVGGAGGARRSSAAAGPGAASHPRRSATTKTVGTGFMTQLNALVQTLQLTSSHYVRAIKPNAKQAPAKFDGPLVRKQLDDSGMPQVLTLMHSGYPTRCPFAQLCDKYRPRAPEPMRALEPRVFIEGLLYALGVPATDFQLGMTQLFFKGSGKMAFLESLLDSDLLSTPQALERLRRWMVLKHWHQALAAAKCAVRFGTRLRYMRAAARLAKHVRVVVRARRVFVPRARAARRVVWVRHAGERIADAWRARALRRRLAAARGSILRVQAAARRLLAVRERGRRLELKRAEEAARLALLQAKAVVSIVRAWHCKAARTELAGLRAVKAERRAAARAARAARDRARAEARAAARIQAAARRVAAAKAFAALGAARSAARREAAAQRAARARARASVRAARRVQRAWRGLAGRRTAAERRRSLSAEALASMAEQTKRARYVGSLREAARELAIARNEAHRAQEKTWGYQELLQSAGTVNGPDVSPVGAEPPPKPAARRLSILSLPMHRKGGGAKGGSTVAPSPAPPASKFRASYADGMSVTPGPGSAKPPAEHSLGLLSATLGSHKDIASARPPAVATSAAAPEGSGGRAVLSPRTGNQPGTPRYGNKGSEASRGFGGSAARTGSSGTPTYGSAAKQASSFAAAGAAIERVA